MNGLDRPLVSVLMTAYNREKYIEEAIVSVLNSTYSKIELIIVDDNSRDGTVDIANKFARTDKRIKIYRNKSNLGDFPNRNRAASFASGKYLKYVDSDDMIYPYGLEYMVKSMERFPDAGAGFCSMPPDKDRIFPFLLSSKEAYHYHYFRNPIFNRSPLSAIFRTDAFKKVRGFLEKRLIGDYELVLLLSMFYPIVLMPEGLVWYRRHSEQESKDAHLYKDDYHWFSIRFLEDPGCPLGSPERESMLRRLILYRGL